MLLFGAGLAIGVLVGLAIATDRERERANRARVDTHARDLAETRYQLALAGLSLNPNLTETLQCR